MAGPRGSMGRTGIGLVSPGHAVAGSGDSCHLADDQEHGPASPSLAHCHLDAA